MGLRAAGAILALVALGMATPRAAHGLLAEGDVTPNFTKTDLGGTIHQLYQYRGKVVVLFLLGCT